MAPFLYAFLREWQSSVVVTEILWTAQPKIYTIWSFLEMLANPRSRKLTLKKLHYLPEVIQLVKSRTGLESRLCDH